MIDGWQVMSPLWGIGVLGLNKLGAETLELGDAGPETPVGFNFLLYTVQP
jgi:hypothetical protein